MADAKKHWNRTYKTRKMVSAVAFAKKAFALLPRKSSISLLDIGCGDGRDSSYFSKNGVQVTAIDFSQEAIRRVRTNTPSINAHIMEISDMRFPDASFDAVYAHLSLHYFDDPTTDAIFQTIHRMLKPGGLFFVRCKSLRDPQYGKGTRVGKDIFLDGHLRHFFSTEYLREKLRNYRLLSLEETSSAYDGKVSAFVEAVAQT
jgi:SAM-dependent methyltransferase